MTKLPITEWAIEDRPREKMLRLGASSLSDTELLAILLRSGNSSETAVQLAQRILHSVDNNLNALGKCSIKELVSNFKGIGTTKAITLHAALELGKRRTGSERTQLKTITCSTDAYLLFYPLLSDLPHEELWIALINRAGKVIDKLKVSQGGTNETTADLRIMLKAAINALASGIILCHNHPSGSVNPSLQDNNLTKKLQTAARTIGINLLDHIIIADTHYYSYADEGELIE